MEESMSSERSQLPTWRERLQVAAQIAALISCICGMTIAYFAYQNSQHLQVPVRQRSVTTQTDGAEHR
jgi:hypothetical protein